ncbi:efflux RND transporter periplasmic adaptor subunit [Henriciella marina]|uniref:efflux RND transporter periplasmic adaptor subunit n=1 Tax=Henriciella marina TaxID=453851 RepID=UPI0003671183|nr:efflux RND transporter periplasmic adaptor subunit [Henriciella marina]
MISRLLKSRLVLVLAIFVLAAAGWFGLKATVLSGAETPDYQTAQATRGDIEVTISAAGKITPKVSVDVGAQVSGQLQELLVEIGDEVEKGDLLARIDPTLAQTSVEANRAQLSELQASRKQQQATLELARADADRAEMLYKADAIARAEFESAQAELTIAQGRLEAIEAQIQRQSSSLQSELANLEFTRIYAPISGTVVSSAAVEGQTLNANQTAPIILTIADLGVMTVETDVSEADVLRIDEGQEAYFTTLGDATRRWDTTVRQVLPTPEVLNDVVLYKALVDVENPQGRLKPQMTAQVFFVTGRASNAVLVPVTALQSRPARTERPQGQGGGQPVASNDGRRRGFMQADAASPDGEAGPGSQHREDFRRARDANPEAETATVLVIAGDGTPQPRRVIVGLKTRTMAEIIYGIDPGETVITGGVSIQRPAGNERGGRRGGGPRFMRG